MSRRASAEPPLVAPTEALSPAEEQKLFHLPPGFEIQLFATEPAIHKPMNMTFDSAGRLFVTDTLEYPYPAKAGHRAARHGQDSGRSQRRRHGRRDHHVCRRTEYSAGRDADSSAARWCTASRR